MFSFPECICVTWAYYANASLYYRLQIVLFCVKLYYHFPVILSLFSCSFFFHFHLCFMSCLLSPFFFSLMHFSQPQIPDWRGRPLPSWGDKWCYFSSVTLALSHPHHALILGSIIWKSLWVHHKLSSGPLSSVLRWCYFIKNFIQFSSYKTIFKWGSDFSLVEFNSIIQKVTFIFIKCGE